MNRPTNMVQKKVKAKTKKRGRPSGSKTKKTKVLEIPKEEKKVRVKRTYDFAVGRRKSAIARIRLHKSGEPKITVNGKDYKEYFVYPEYRMKIEEPLQLLGQKNKHCITIKVQGGGIKGQAESCRLGIARILTLINPSDRSALKRALLLRRDDRVKERKKFGLKRARRAPQWQKR